MSKHQQHMDRKGKPSTGRCKCSIDKHAPGNVASVFPSCRRRNNILARSSTLTTCFCRDTSQIHVIFNTLPHLSVPEQQWAHFTDSGVASCCAASKFLTYKKTPKRASGSQWRTL